MKLDTDDKRWHMWLRADHINKLEDICVYAYNTLVSYRDHLPGNNFDPKYRYIACALIRRGLQPIKGDWMDNCLLNIENYDDLPTIDTYSKYISSALFKPFALYHGKELVDVVHAAILAMPHKPAEKAINRQFILELFREVIPPPVDYEIKSEWLKWENSTIARMVKAIVDNKDFAHLPVLADALEEAGCTNTLILNHCRQPGRHYYGCWFLDECIARY